MDIENSCIPSIHAHPAISQHTQGKRKAEESLEHDSKPRRPYTEVNSSQSTEKEHGNILLLESGIWSREHQDHCHDGMIRFIKQYPAAPYDNKNVYTKPRSDNSMANTLGEIFLVTASCSSRSSSPPDLSSGSTRSTESSSTSHPPSPSIGSQGHKEDTDRDWRDIMDGTTPPHYPELHRDIPMVLDIPHEKNTRNGRRGDEDFTLNHNSSWLNPKSSATFQKNLEISENESLSGTAAPSPEPSPSMESHPAPTSYSGGEDDTSPVDGSSESQSRSSSQVTGSPVENLTPCEASNTLMGVLNNVLKSDPAVAKLMHSLLEGQLEWDPSGTDLEPNSSLSTLSLLNVKDPSPLLHHGNFTFSAPSDAGSSASSSPTNKPGGVNKSLPSTGSSGGVDSKTPGTGNTARGSMDGVGRGLRTKSQSDTLAPGKKAHSLRCIHNVLAPATFCTNHQTREKYRACGGPGWDIAHLKDHMKATHRKSSDLLKCSNCQETFKSQDLLTRHTNTVDCLIRCPDCGVEFGTKALRTTHQEERHPGIGNQSQFMEIDDTTWKKMNENLKKFTGSAKPGEPAYDAESKISKWIARNTPRYMEGRPENAKAYLELGQWYTMFVTLAIPDSPPPEHPFYDFLPVTELVQERVLLIFERLIMSKVETHGSPPPSDPENLPSQIGWYKETLGESLKIASLTKLKVEQQNPIGSTMSPPYPGVPNLEEITQAAVYNSPELMVQNDVPVMHTSQLPMMDRQLSNISGPQESFFQHGPQQQASSSMVWQGQPSVEAFSYPTPQAYSTQHGYSTHQDYTDQLEFSGTRYSQNTPWQDPGTGQDPSGLAWAARLQQHERNQRRQ